LNLVLATSLAILAAAAPDTLAPPVPVYGAVIADLRTHAPVPPDLPVVLNARMFNSEGGPVIHKLPVETLRQLQEGGWIDATCDGQTGSPGCIVPEGAYTSVRFGPVIEMDDTARVKVLPVNSPPGRSLTQILAAIPDSLAVPVNVAADVVIHTPCPEPPESERCRVPDVVIYRYFLRAEPAGGYHVVTRWLIGAV